MDIHNVTQFANFLSKEGLQGLDMIFQSLIFCINNFSATCSCQGAAEKQKLYNNCTMIYMNAVNSIVPKYKNEFLSKTSDRQIQFYTDNGSLIGLICR